MMRIARELLDALKAKLHASSLIVNRR